MIFIKTIHDIVKLASEDFALENLSIDDGEDADGDVNVSSY